MRMMKVFVLPLFFLGNLFCVGEKSPARIHHINIKSVNNDGPYILYRNNMVFVKQIDGSNGSKKAVVDSVSVSEKENIILQVGTDTPDETFSVKIKAKLENEKGEFPGVKRMIVISDIEGNFKAFKKLLQANRVIDSNYDWIFGDGHLVLTGDFFDRGIYVSQVLWLIYSLEEKAKEAGGYVHFILGNHEIMNLNGDLRYVNPGYFENAALLKETYSSLYGKNSEIGRWLRTKNVVEQVGNILFVHGGISSDVNNLGFSASRINKLARPYYDDTTGKYPNRVSLLYGDTGPFWYRGYYIGDRVEIEGKLDSTLYEFGVKHVATGHTVIADTVSSLFKGKLFNTDVKHAYGQSEALLVEDNKFYRVDGLGQKFLIAQ